MVEAFSRQPLAFYSPRAGVFVSALTGQAISSGQWVVNAQRLLGYDSNECRMLLVYVTRMAGQSGASISQTCASWGWNRSTFEETWRRAAERLAAHLCELGENTD
mgnify:FL=1